MLRRLRCDEYNSTIALRRLRYLDCVATISLRRLCCDDFVATVLRRFFCGCVVTKLFPPYQVFNCRLAHNVEVLAKAGTAWFSSLHGIDARFCQYHVICSPVHRKILSAYLSTRVHSNLSNMLPACLSICLVTF
jgi:hypothetical protein